MTTGNEELQEALESIDMEQWLDREGVKYRVTRGARGTQLNVRDCPVCGGGNWKVYLNAESGLGNCFSGDCETKFNKWKFIKASLGAVSTRQVVEHCKEVAKEMGWRPVVKTSAPVQAATTPLRLVTMASSFGMSFLIVRKVLMPPPSADVAGT